MYYMLISRKNIIKLNNVDMQILSNKIDITNYSNYTYIHIISRRNFK